MISGYVEEGETPEQTTKRETKEETGRSIDNNALAYESSAGAHNNRLLLFFSTTSPDILFEGVADTNEMRNIRFASPADIEAKPLCFPLHQKALMSAWIQHRPDLFPEPVNPDDTLSWMDTFQYT